MTLYLVGGAVRDKLLGHKPKDYDYVYVSTQNTTDDAFHEMQTYLENNGYKIFLKTKECFTIRARHDSQVADFVLARKEISYDHDSRMPTCIPGTLYDDLERRDFTVNAIAEGSDGILYDPFNGQTDLQKCILRTPIDPMKSFGDDPLRLLRAVRFAITKGFTFSSELAAAFATAELWQKLQRTVSIERVREELHKCFAHDTIQTLTYLHQVRPDILTYIFSTGLWLKPTLEHPKT